MTETIGRYGKFEITLRMTRSRKGRKEIGSIYPMGLLPFGR